MPTITCPQCGARRSTPEHKLPNKPTKARCPDCRQTFLFNPEQQRSETVEQQTYRVNCPHCTLPREIPKDRIKNEKTTVNCRRCKHSFQLNLENEQIKASPPQLRKISQLLTDSWELFCRRGWGLLVIYLVSCLLLLGPLVIGIFNFSTLMGNPALLWSILVLACLYFFLIGSWASASLFNHVCDRELGLFAALGKGRKQFWKFGGLLILLGLVITGGSLLLIIPGLIFTVWFFFCNYALAEDGGSILKAMGKSRQLVSDHWWAVFGRFSLLLLVAVAISMLAGRLPVIGGPLNVSFTLIMTPFSLIYYYLIYQDLKACQPAVKKNASGGNWLPVTLALLGWMVVPGLLFISNRSETFQKNDFPLLSSELISEITGPHVPDQLLNQEQQPKNSYQWPQNLSLSDYEQLLGTDPQSTRQGLTLGPATLSAEHFWIDDHNPHLWLKLEMNEATNLALSQNRSTRILIDKVLDNQRQDRYNREHSFENSAFHWINIRNRESLNSSYSGIRNVYLKAGTRPEQIRSIKGMLEFNLPIGIETLKIKAKDVGRTIKVAGKRLKVEALKKDGISLTFSGRQAELLSVRARNNNAEYLPEAGFTLQRDGRELRFKQMFSGDIDSVTILVASESVPRRYPFEITR